MMKALYILLLLLVAGAVAGQTIDPDAQPAILEPADSDAFYTQERGPLYKIRLDTLKSYYTGWVYSDSTSVIQDSIWTYYRNGIEVGRDTVPISAYGSVGTDDQQLSLSGLFLSIEDGNAVNLAALLQDFDLFSLSGTVLSISLTGKSAIDTVDLASLQDGTGTDDQTLSLTGTSLSIEDGNSVDLASLQDGTGTDDQMLSVSYTTLVSGFVENEIGIEDGNLIYTYDNDRQDLTLAGTNLSIENGNTVDLSGIGGDDLGNHTLTQDLITSNNNIRNSVSSAMRMLPLASRIAMIGDSGTVSVYSDGLALPVSLDNTPETGVTMWLGRYQDGDTTRWRPHISVPNDQVLTGGLTPSFTKRVLTEEDISSISGNNTYTAVKTADETKTGGDTDDTDLTLALPTGIYHVTVDLMWSSDATNGIEFDFGLAADFDGGYSLDRSANKETLIGWGTNNSINGSGSTVFLTHYRGILLVDGSSPDFTLSWGKLVSGDTGSAILKKGSTIRAEYVGAN